MNKILKLDIKKYIAFLSILFCFFIDLSSNAQCLTGQTNICTNGNCGTTDESRDIILGLYLDYQLDQTAYDLARQEVEQRKIPVVFHIVNQCGEEKISRAQCETALQEVNDDFQGVNEELTHFSLTAISPFDEDLDYFDTFHFELASLDEHHNATTGITYTTDNSTFNGTTAEGELKNLIQWDPTKYLNVWVVNSTGGSGFAHYPSYTHSNPVYDGIVISHNYLSLTGTANPIDHKRRHTLSHEIGHWLGLRHTYGDTNQPEVMSNCDEDDDLCDTPTCVGFNDIVYPNEITFTYPEGDATFNQDGYSTLINSVNSASQSSGYGIVNHYNYKANNSNITNLVNGTGLPYSCGVADCVVDGPPVNRPDNIYNMMDYGASFMFTKEQIRLMVAVLNCDIAGRSGIGKIITDEDEDDPCPPFLTATPNQATITTDSYFFIESDYNNDLLKTEGVTITLSEGTFDDANILVTNNQLTPYDLTYDVQLTNSNQSAIIRLVSINNDGTDLELIPDGGLQDIDISINLNKVTLPNSSYSVYNADGNQLTIEGFAINLGKEKFPIHHNYNHTVSGDICLDDVTFKPGYTYSSKKVSLGGSLVRYLSLYSVNDQFSGAGNGNGLLDEGFYLANNSPIDVEVLVKDNGAGKGDIPFFSYGTDIINGVDNTLYKYASLTGLTTNVDPSSEIQGMARLYSPNFPDNLNSEGYIALRFQIGCEAAWYYAWIKASVQDVNGIIQGCLLEGQFQNIPYNNPNPSGGNYIVGIQDCDNPYPENENTVWINKVELNGTILGSTSSDAEGYADNTGLGSLVELNTGVSNIAMDLETASSKFTSYVIAFVDYKFPYGIYDYSEKVLLEEVESNTTTYNFTGSINIPSEVPSGTYSMRVINSSWKYNNQNPDYYLNPCNSIKYGEVEDYLINIFDGVSSTDDCKLSEEYNANNPLSAYLPPVTNVETFITAKDREIQSGQDVQFLAGDYVLLNPGFETKENTVFEAKIEGCTPSTYNPFTDNSWLAGIVNPDDCCGAETIYEYKLGDYSYFYIEGDANCGIYPGELYYNGSKNCTSNYNAAPPYFCPDQYIGMVGPVNVWSCSGTPPVSSSDIFNTYTWLDDLVNPTDCCPGQVVIEYVAASGLFYVLVEGGSCNNYDVIYKDDGAPFCTNTPNLCLDYYIQNSNFTTTGNTWSCSTSAKQSIEASTLEEVLQIELTIAPNPFSELFEIQYNLQETEPITIELYSLDGKKIQTIVDGQVQQEGFYSQTVDGANLQSGIYLIHLSSSSNREVRKLIKM